MHMELPARNALLPAGVTLLLLVLGACSTTEPEEAPAPTSLPWPAFVMNDVQIVRIEAFEWRGPERPNIAMEQVIVTDLMTSGASFEVVAPGGVSQQPASKRRVTAVQGVVARSSSDASKYDVDIALVDANSGVRLAARRYVAAASSFRHVAHRISDDLFRSFTGREGIATTRIAYVIPVNGEQESTLIVAAADLTEGQVVMKSKKAIRSPAWSPDGRSLAYESFENDQPGVFVQEMASGMRRKIVATDSDAAPAWSPDGRTLALSMGVGEEMDIAVFDLESGTLERITRDADMDSNPSWSPEGRTVYFDSRSAGVQRICWVSVASRYKSCLPFQGDRNSRPEVSPTGKHLAFIARSPQGKVALMLSDMNGGNARPIVGGDIQSHSFSPDGQLILYVVREGEGTVIRRYSLAAGATLSGAMSNASIDEAAWGPLTSR